jgi:hypothetical protein
MALKRVPASSLESLVRARLDETVEDEAAAALMRALRAARRRGYLTRAEFEAACRWKSARSVHHVRSNTPAAVRAATRAALRARGEERRLEALTSLRGVSVPTASALLTLLFPRRYGVIDIRVWQLLHRMGRVGTNARGAGFTLAEWRTFLEVVRGVAARLGVTARVVELTLFGVHVHYQRGTLYARRKGAPR